MWESITLYLESKPQAYVATIIPLAFVMFSWAGIVLVRPILRLWMRRQPQANDLITYASAGFSLFYGLLLGLLSVATYQNTKDVDDFVNREAMTIGTIYRSIAAYPEPLRTDLRSSLRDYTLFVVNKDWPAHNNGVTPMGGEHRLQVIRDQLFAFDPSRKTEEILHGEVLREFNKMVGYREQRLNGVETTIPVVLWYVVGVGALINIAFMWMMEMRLMPNLLLTGLVSFFLGIMVFLIFTMDRPLRGEGIVTAEPFKRTYETVMKWDAPY
jgi:hypothetical protein